MHIELVRLRNGRLYASRIARTGFLTPLASTLHKSYRVRPTLTSLRSLPTTLFFNIQYHSSIIFQNFRHIWKSF